MKLHNVELEEQDVSYICAALQATADGAKAAGQAEKYLHGMRILHTFALYVESATKQGTPVRLTITPAF